MSETIASLIAAAQARLQKAGCETARLDAKLLLAEAAGLSAVTLAADPQLVIETQVVSRFQAMIQRREQREPVSKIIGRRGFWSLDLEVTADTLDPRPDSETLIEWALELLPANRALRFVDFGTGTGCLLLALLSERPLWTGIGVDISAAALDVARRNADLTGLSDRADFLHSDWDAQMQEQNFDFILSNPPYIAMAEMAELAPEVRDFDPQMALTDGADGLRCYERLAQIAADRLYPEGVILVEHGFTQHAKVDSIFLAAGLKSLGSKKDLGGKVRCTAAIKTRV